MYVIPVFPVDIICYHQLSQISVSPLQQGDNTITSISDTKIKIGNSLLLHFLIVQSMCKATGNLLDIA